MDDPTMEPCPDWSDEARRAFFDRYEREIGLLLQDTFGSVLRDKELKAILHFRSAERAAGWAIKRFLSPGWTPTLAVDPTDYILDASLFAHARLWVIERLADVQNQDEEGAPGHRRRGSRDRVFLAQNIEDHAEAPCAITAPQRDDEDVWDFVERINSSLAELAARTHRHVEILWLRHHRRLRRALAAYLGTVTDDGFRSDELTDALARLSESGRSKAGAIAAFRFMVLHDGALPRAISFDAAAFTGTYFTSFEKADWPARPRDRWDVVPKRVVAKRMAVDGYEKATPNRVAVAARRALGAHVGDALRRGEELVEEPPPRDSDGRVWILRVLLTRESIVATLCDEYRRSDRGTVGGPTSRRIEHWRNELEEAIGQRRRGEDR